MDLSNAFDSIPYALLLVKLKAYGLDETSIERGLKLNWDTFTEWALVRRGVPQGSALIPDFFNLHINDLFYHIKQANLNVYTDDEKLYSSEKDLETLNTWLEQELGIANSWHERNGTIVNPDKHQAEATGLPG